MPIGGGIITGGFGGDITSPSIFVNI